MDYEEELGPAPVLAGEDTPAFDGWCAPALGDMMDAALDSFDPKSTEGRAQALHSALLRRGIRHIVHYDGPEQSVTVRLDKYGADFLAAFVESHPGI
ncbi:hypothetical protein WKI65_43550 [Streptomyces sp. MS1.AVA.3]|uniref:hypothetical protein n=1 Tax=Streptomyces decoyicus TaxID=249567 RepID=UPI0030C032DF